MFCGVYVLNAVENFKCIYDNQNGLVQIHNPDIGIVINPIAADLRYWRMRFNLILYINIPSPLCKIGGCNITSRKYFPFKLIVDILVT